MKYVVDNAVYQALRSFYKNVAKKYCNVYTSEDVEKDFTKACQSIYRIENGLMRRQPRMDKWEGMYMATAGKWNFAYKIEGDTVYVCDACHSQNIHESSERRTIILTESELKEHLKKAVRKVLDTLGRDNRCAINEESYIHPKAKPIKLGEWEEIDSLPLDTILTGFEDKGYVLPQCLFLNKEKNEGFGLYKRADNNKYFYLKLVPDENNVTTYVSVKRSDVPEVILSDFPQYLRRAWERIRPIIEKEH